MNRRENDKIEETRRRLDEISSCFCLAKWTQVTLHLHNGTGHSCHHPTPQKIPLKEIKSNPAALHNTSHKIDQRKSMLKGKRPKECDFCWRIEDAPGDNTSDRILKSSDEWSLPFFEEILKNPLSERFVPPYVEVNLGSLCSFKCSYCGPHISSRWQSEIEKFGRYPTSSKDHDFDPKKAPLPEDSNPYLDAWWKWWPELYPKLQTFRMTGGEPTLNKNLYRILDWIEEHPNPNLTLGVNTHLCPPEELWSKFLAKLKRISESGSVKRVHIFTSSEAWAERAEYIRFGLDFKLWLDRLWQAQEALKGAKFTIMSTYNALSVTSFDLFLQEMSRIKNAKQALRVDVSYLRYPAYQSIKVLTPDFVSYLNRHADFMRDHFSPSEAQKMERIRNWFTSESDELDHPRKKNTLRADFYRFFSEHDRRRSTNFLATFPELGDFWDLCRSCD